jgi:hypothetical protein
VARHAPDEGARLRTRASSKPRHILSPTPSPGPLPLAGERVRGDGRDYAAKKEEAERGMAEMSAKFKDVGSEIYVHSTGEKRAPID